MNSSLVAVIAAFAIIILGLQIQIVKLKQRIQKLEGAKK